MRIDGKRLLEVESKIIFGVSVRLLHANMNLTRINIQQFLTNDAAAFGKTIFIDTMIPETATGGPRGCIDVNNKQVDLAWK